MRFQSSPKICGVALFSAFALLPSLAWAVDVPQWSTHEIRLTASGEHANPYTDPSAAVTAVFTGPGGQTRAVAGFWDGGKTFKIRFTPTAEGAWSFKTSSRDSGLDGKTGVIQCVAPRRASTASFASTPNIPTASSGTMVRGALCGDRRTTT